MKGEFEAKIGVCNKTIIFNVIKEHEPNSSTNLIN